ncbi:UDP-N-acetylmuramate--L-alanine ligase [Eubacteriales bacterium OttesenSCG-928-K08]|nr:UDP-N-acetylmuramate--L-alanine ligase [Eubacteriales bacterium OttesenSCG-928-K08]
MLEAKQKIFLIGIGGCSMNGLAQILAARGYSVSGSDRDSSPFTDTLIKMGIPVFIGHDAKHVEGAQLVIYSAAIKPDHVERAAARALGIPEMERSVALGEISAQYESVVGIAGCHGKTTITSMLASITLRGVTDATVHVGGNVDFLSGGTKVGNSGLFITEACEYVESFLTLRPTTVLISNIDDDHLDYYADIGEIVEAFRKFLRLLPADGLFIGCIDDQHVRSLLSAPDKAKRTISYGFDKDAAYRPINLEFDERGFASFDLAHRGTKLAHIKLNIPGKHNVLNAVGAAVVALELGESVDDIAMGLEAYTLTARRFEKYGENNGVSIYHDYAHHPAEVRAVLDAAARVSQGKLWCVFQCNSFTRAKTLFSRNVTCFLQANEVLVPNIFPGREVDDGSVHARDMVNGINMAQPGKAKYIPTFEEIREYLDEHAQPGDLVLTLGSGDVYKQTNKLL